MSIDLTEVDRSFNLLQDQARGKVNVDFKAWERHLPKFLEHQPNVTGKVKVGHFEVGSAGSDAGNLIFTAEMDMGKGLTRQKFVVRFGGTGDIKRGFKIQKGMHSSGIPVAEPLWIDECGDALPETAYIMKWIEGIAPMQSYFTRGVLANAAADERKKMITSAIKVLAQIHAVYPKSCGLDFLLDELEEYDVFDLRLMGIQSAFQAVDPSAIKRLKPAFEWLKTNKPDQKELVLCHGDSNLSNFMFQGNELVGVLDVGHGNIAPRECDLAHQCIPNTLFAMGLDEETDGVLCEERWIAEYEMASGYKVRDWQYYRISELLFLSYVMCWFRAKATDEVIKDTYEVSTFWENMLMKRIM